MDRDRLSDLCDQGLTQRAIGERLGISHGTVRYWLRQHGVRTDGRPPARIWDANAFISACESSMTVVEVLDKMGASKYSGNYRRAAQLAEELGVVLPVARKGSWAARIVTPILSDDEVLARFRRTDRPQDSKSLKRWMARRPECLRELRPRPGVERTSAHVGARPHRRRPVEQPDRQPPPALPELPCPNRDEQSEEVDSWGCPRSSEDRASVS